jgi:nucleotide-binding universal stress UspA family protein
MISASKILVPSDFSEESREALDYAVELGARLGAEVDVLHVWEPPRSTDSRSDLLTEFVRSDAGHKMLDVLGTLEQRSDLEAHGRVAPGARRDVPAAIVDAVESGHYDLIVMATHGRDRLSLILRRGVADEVIRRASCPVVTVRAPSPPILDPPMAVGVPW